jgi:penicillin-binding protein 2
MVTPRLVRNIDTLELCDLLGITKDEFIEGISKARAFSGFIPSLFYQQISKETYAVMQERMFRFPGFFVQPRTLRKYTYPLAAHIFGDVGEVNKRDIEKDRYYRSGDYIGKSGIELSYEEEIRGKKGIRVLLVDVHNRIIGPYQDGLLDTVSIPGKDIYCTIDATLQQYAEKLMQNKRGSIVAIEPSSGEILTLVSAPTFDPNLLVGRARNTNYMNLLNDDRRPFFNRALQASYPPGSAFKVLNTLIALQEEVVRPNANYGCNGAYYAGGIRVGCRNHPNPVNAISSIQWSCNAYSCNVFRGIIDKSGFANVQAGYNNWKRHVNSFGFGETFGSDLSHELRGLVPTSDYYDRIYGTRGWSSLTIISLAIGQGELGTTPLQLANLSAIVANRGFYHPPHIVRAIGNPDHRQERFQERKTTTVAHQHFELMAKAMEEVVNAGTGRASMIPGISMGGKTGTVQNPHGQSHSVFIAFAPVDNPKIAISVIVENAGGGSTWAAPIASLLVEKYLTGEIKREHIEKRILEASFEK